MPKRVNTAPPIHDEASRQDAESDALFLSIGEGAVVTDERGYISRINSVALNMLGLEENEVIGKWYPEALIAENEDGSPIPSMERPITEAFLSGEPVSRRVYYRKKNGTRMPAAITVSPVMVNGQPVGAIQVFRDITQEVELENAKDEFISIASHQLRTPATVVKQHIGMMLEGYMGKLTEAQHYMLKTAYEHNDYQLTIINDLLKVAQLDANKVQVVRKKIDLVALLDDVIKTQQPEYDQKDMSLVFKYNVDSLTGKVDPLHLRMVFENLLDNAKKYSRSGDHVKVTLSKTAEGVEVTVADEGVGIAKKDLPKLFQKFSRIDNALTSSSGTGLGLYWVQKLVEMHGGSVSVTSRLHKGTTFVVRIPFEDVT